MIQDFQVTVIAPRGNDKYSVEMIDGVRVYRFPAPLLASGFFSYALEFGYATLAMLVLSLWVALKHGVDVIHAANTTDTLFVIGCVFRLLGKKYVFDQHDLSPETYLSRFHKPQPDWVYKCLRMCERLSYSCADIVVSTNDSYAQLAITRGRKDPKSVFLVRNGPPLSYQPLPQDADIVNRARHLIGYVGTIGPQDGVDYLVRAIHEMVTGLGRRDVLAIVIGDGDALKCEVACKDPGDR